MPCSLGLKKPFDGPRTRFALRRQFTRALCDAVELFIAVAIAVSTPWRVASSIATHAGGHRRSASSAVGSVAARGNRTAIALQSHCAAASAVAIAVSAY